MHRTCAVPVLTPVLAASLGLATAHAQTPGPCAFDLAGPTVLGALVDAIGLATGDLNRDGHADVVAAGRAGTLVVYLNDGAGGLAAAYNDEAAGSTRGVALGDMDGDGDLDAVLVARSGAVTVRLNDGMGRLPAQHSYGIDAAAFGVALGDLNGDGVLDVVVGVDDDGDQVVLFSGVGDGSLTNQRGRPAPGAPAFVDLADLDADGHLDLIISRFDADRVRVILGDGAGGFPVSVDLVSGDGPRRPSAVDVNGDGVLDLVAPHQHDASVGVWLGNGLGGFAPMRIYSTPSRPLDLAVGDLDGAPDLVVCTSTAAAGLAVLLNNGDGLFLDRRDWPASGTLITVALADFSGDGAQDVAACAFTGDQVRVWRTELDCPEPCRADLDADGALTIFDFLAFQNLFDLGSTLADFDGDGELTIFDFLAFQNAFDAGCA